MNSRLCPCGRKSWRLRSVLFLFNLQALLLQQLKMCASALVVGVSAMVLVRVIGDVASALVSLSAIVLVGAGVVALALVLALGGAPAFALGGACGGLADDRFARIVDPKTQWQYFIWRLFPLDRLDTDFTQSLSVRQVRGWRGFPRWNLAGLYHTLKQATLTNRG